MKQRKMKEPISNLRHMKKHVRGVLHTPKN